VELVIWSMSVLYKVHELTVCMKSSSSLLVTLPLVGERAVLWRACLYVCLQAYLQNCTSHVTKFSWILRMAVAQSFCCGVVISCILLVLSVTSRLLTVARIGKEKKHILKVTQQWAARIWYCSAVLLKLTHHEATPNWGRSLISTVALFTDWSAILCRFVHMWRETCCDCGATQ